MADSKLDLLQGTLDLMVLNTLASMGSLHGYGIARRIEHVSGHAILLNQGTIYASLVRLQQRGWISSEWGTSDNNRRAKYYSLTVRGRLLANAVTARLRVDAGRPPPVGAGPRAPGRAGPTIADPPVPSRRPR